jgi:hypothetical protein
MRTTRLVITAVGVLGLVLTLGVLKTNASAAQPGCDTVKGQLTETTVPSPNDPFGRTIGVLSGGRVKGPATSRFTSVVPTATPGGFHITTDEVFVPGAGQNLTATGDVALTPDPLSPGTYLADETLTITGGTGSLAGATGTISLSGTATGLLSPPGVLDLSYRGSVCTA